MGKAKSNDDCDPDDDRISFLWKEGEQLFGFSRAHSAHTRGLRFSRCYSLETIIGTVLLGLVRWLDRQV
jgi:hypothetical protein